MASNNCSEKLGSPHEDARSAEFGTEELEELESDVKEMAQKILEYRATLPDQLRTTLTSVLAAQRPLIPQVPDPGSSEAPDIDASEQDVLSRGKLLAEEDPETAKKKHLLKEKLSSNASAMPVVLKRMKDCIEKIEKLDLYNVTIHPAFKRKRTRQT